MEEFDASTSWEDRAFYFCGQLTSPVVAKLWYFRPEDEYESEGQAETTAMQLIRLFAECIETRAFLLFVSDAGSPSAVRSKKGVLWDHKELRQLPHIAFECECKDGESRLGAIVDLGDFDFDSASSAVLNWGQGMIVLSNEPLETVRGVVEQWASREVSDVLAYDYDGVATSLRQNAKTGILRYMPPSSTRPETVVVVANKTFVDKNACECIDAIN